MNDTKALNIYFVLGEESGDVLGSKIIEALTKLPIEIELNGLAGKKMQDKGVASLFDISELSVMGISAVISKLPSLLKRVKQTAKDIIKKSPDVVLLIDSPEFAYRVAKKVRKQSPQIKIVKFVAPTVWAWRPGRAKKITPYIDEIFAILPFEPELMKELGGPTTTYVGHPLAANIPDISIKEKITPSKPVNILVLPGSRNGELKLLMPVIRETLRILKLRSLVNFEITVPAVEKLEATIRQETKDWAFQPNIVKGEEAKISAFKKADLALAVSGTVTLELALYKVPMISIYKLDRAMMMVRHMITAWTTSLPNLIADYPFVPEKLNENAHPEHLARMLEKLAVEGPERQAQLNGFEIVEQNMRQETPPETLVAKKILSLAGKQ